MNYIINYSKIIKTN